MCRLGLLGAIVMTNVSAGLSAIQLRLGRFDSSTSPDSASINSARSREFLCLGCAIDRIQPCGPEPTSSA